MDAVSVIVLIALALVALLAAGLILGARRKRASESLKERFGPEYDRAVDEHGGQRAAEKRLGDVADRRDKLDIRALQPAERERYTQQWTGVQAAFVDDPRAATRDADRVVGAVMRERGYPVDDFETKADMMAAGHPEVTEHYRAAHAVGTRGDTASTEELRQAFVHYRALFDELLTDRDVDIRPGERAERTPPA
ncbi:MAG: hypothetical protein ACRDWY_13870 [Actinomycetes bacterium]